VSRGSTPWLETTVVATPNGTTSDALVIADLAHVAWAVNKGCLGFHVWPARADDPAHADELRIDLDPTPGVTFPMVRDAARLVQEVLVEHGLTGWPKTTGNRGIHIYLRLEPRWDSYEVRSAAVALARELERRAPELVTAAWWKEERGERVFVDYNQNAPHKTVFGAWCVRARPGAQVSTPFSWDELDDDLHPDRFTMRSSCSASPPRGPVGGDVRAAAVRSTRCSSCTSGTWPQACRTPRGLGVPEAAERAAPVAPVGGQRRPRAAPRPVPGLEVAATTRGPPRRPRALRGATASRRSHRQPLPA
jgi:DNA ligase D-like protein (predicted polymerase)